MSESVKGGGKRNLLYSSLVTLRNLPIKYLDESTFELLTLFPIQSRESRHTRLHTPSAVPLSGTHSSDNGERRSFTFLRKLSLFHLSFGRKTNSTLIIKI